MRYVDLLQKIIEEKGIEADSYSRGGVVEELETKMAEALGKQRAIYFPTGTLANHIAVRELAMDSTRVIVPHDSHLYNDSGDCAIDVILQKSVRTQWINRKIHRSRSIGTLIRGG